MTFTNRLLPSLLFSALLSSAAFLSACSPTPSAFCDETKPCGTGETCDLVANACETVVEADASAPDATPVPIVCEGGNRCVAEIPTDWVGPLVYSTADTMENLAACPSAYMEEIAVVGNEIAETADCSCSCGDIANPTCGSAHIQVNNGSCPGNVFCQNNICEEILVSPTSTPSAASHIGDQVQALFPSVTGGTCAQALVSSDLTSNFSALSRLCQSTPLNASCNETETCAPQIPVGFVPQQCIAREGDFECPATGPYTERTTLFASIEDDRECDGAACVCGTSVSCRGTMYTQSPSPIMGNAPIVHESTPGCFTVSSVSGIEYNYIPDSDLACRRDGSAVVTGNATPTGATTLCCEPAQ